MRVLEEASSCHFAPILAMLSRVEARRLVRCKLVCIVHISAPQASLAPLNPHPLLCKLTANCKGVKSMPITGSVSPVYSRRRVRYGRHGCISARQQAAGSRQKGTVLGQPAAPSPGRRHEGPLALGCISFVLSLIVLSIVYTA